MRKGDAKRQEMLNAAEKLFCSRGYEATSVQDILNVLHASKGGFYHYFASKEEVLKTLCSQRAARAAGYVQEAMSDSMSPMARINAVLHGFLPLRREEVPFVSMLLPVIEKPEGRTMAMVYQDALLEEFLPLLEKEMAAAAAQGVVCPPVRDMEIVVLHLANHCWMEAAASLLRIIREGLRYDTSALLVHLERYRRGVEVLMDAPFGSVEMIRIEEWEEVAQRLIRTLENN